MPYSRSQEIKLIYFILGSATLTAHLITLFYNSKELQQDKAGLTGTSWGGAFLFSDLFATAKKGHLFIYLFWMFSSHFFSTQYELKTVFNLRIQ